MFVEVTFWLKKMLLLCFIAVCVFRYVITFGLRGKYDVDGHYSRFAA